MTSFTNGSCGSVFVPAPHQTSAPENVLCQQRGKVDVGSAGKKLFIIVHEFMIWAVVTREGILGYRASPMVLRVAFGSPRAPK